MLRAHLIFLVVAVLGTSASTATKPGNGTLVEAAGANRPLARQKRYVVFPRGSSIQLVYCMSVGGYIPFQTMFVFGLTGGLAWQLPTDPQQIYLQRRDVGGDPDRDHRYSLYRSVQLFLNQRGLHGEECVQRTLCESTRDTEKRKRSFMEEVLKVLFSLPETNERKTAWDAAKYDGISCEKRFPRCSSVLDIAIPVQTDK